MIDDILTAMPADEWITAAEIGKVIGRDGSAVANYMRLYLIPEKRVITDQVRINTAAPVVKKYKKVPGVYTD